jgi:putative phosphoribosyl transferase
VPVAVQVAHALGAPIDVFVSRKIGLPGHEEFGIGAVAEGAAGPVRSDVVRELGLRDDEFEAIAQRERDEVVRRVQLYRGARRLPDLRGREVVLVDDGLATGVTAEAALRSLRAAAPSRLVLAAPVCARDTAERLAKIADDVVYVDAHDDFIAVGRWYQNFAQTSDDEVRALLATRVVDVREVAITTGDEIMKADLALPERPRGLVVFAHGSGNSRASLRNRYVAETLQAAGFGTLLLDLLTHDQCCDADLLAQRLVDTVAWLDHQPTVNMPVGVLVDAASEFGGDALERVRVPKLLIDGSGDEPGALQRVAQFACDWFNDHLGAVAAPQAVTRSA